MRVVSLRGRQAEPLPEPAHLTVELRADQQVPVAGHQAVRKEFQVQPLERFSQDAFERFVVLPCMEDGRASIGSLEHMIDGPRFVRSLGLPPAILPKASRPAFPNALVNHIGT